MTSVALAKNIRETRQVCLDPAELVNGGQVGVAYHRLGVS